MLSKLPLLSFREWRIWIAGLPWVLKWFPLLVLLRPVIDNLYFLKEVSPLLSPPYVVGVLTPLLCVSALLQYRLPAFAPAEKSYLAWGISLLLGSLLVFLHDPLSLLSIEFVLKISMPVYLFFFLRVLIRSADDLNGILTSFLYSAIFVAAILLYELLIGPISLEESRGLMRIQGSFGDVVSYGMYIVFTTIVTTYYFFARQAEVSSNKLLALLLVVATINVLGLVNIHHTATYSIFIMLFGLFLLYNFQTRNEGLALGILLGAGLAMGLFGSSFIQEKITPLLETDLAIYQGEKSTDQLFHGRVGRWRLMLSNFFQENPLVQFLGLPLRFDPVFPYIGIGSHNDFFRIMFATGYIGLFFYCRFLWRLLQGAVHLAKAQRYLLYSTAIALLFYSISVTPTFYAPFLYFALSVFAFALLPKQQSRA